MPSQLVHQGYLFHNHFMTSTGGHLGYCKTEWGWALLEHDKDVIYQFEFERHPKRGIKVDPVSQNVFEQLLKHPERFKLQPQGTIFQKAVWQALIKIPYGQTASYADIARAIGKPKSFRAVGNAVGDNPICLFIPCHRVIRSDGGLGGFSSGIDLKKIFMRREGITPPQKP